MIRAILQTNLFDFSKLKNNTIPAGSSRTITTTVETKTIIHKGGFTKQKHVNICFTIQNNCSNLVENYLIKTCWNSPMVFKILKLTEPSPSIMNSLYFEMKHIINVNTIILKCNLLLSKTKCKVLYSKKTDISKNTFSQIPANISGTISSDKMYECNKCNQIEIEDFQN